MSDDPKSAPVPDFPIASATVFRPSGCLSPKSLSTPPLGQVAGSA